MPYGFNDDKSMFDLSDINQSTEGTFTVNPATSGDRITNADIVSWAEGRIGCVQGTFTPRFTYGGAFWLLVGTTDILPAVETGGVGISYESYGSISMKITTDGNVYIYISANYMDNTAQAFNISYIIAE